MRFSVFALKNFNSVFRFCCPLRFPVFPFISILVFGFLDFGDRCAFLVFPI